MIMKMTQMKKIENNIGVEGAKMISEVLKCNITLTTLNLYRDEKEQKK